MAQIVSGQAGYLGGETGGTGNGVGAVIFDKPDNTGAQMLFQALQNNARLRGEQEAAKRKEQVAKELSAIDGINLDTKGVFDPDVPYFQEQTKGLVDEYGKIMSDFNGDLTSLDAAKRLNQLEGRKAALKLEAEQSAEQKKLWAAAQKELLDNPSKYNQEKYNEASKLWLDPTARNKRVGVQLLHSATPDIMEAIREATKEVKPSKETSIGDTRLINGRYFQAIKKGYNPQDLENAADMMLSSPKLKPSVEDAYNRIAPEEVSRYQVLADKYNAQAAQNPDMPQVSPMKLFARDQAKAYKSGEEETLRELAESGQDKLNRGIALKRAGYDIQHEEDEYKYQQLVNTLNGDLSKIGGVIPTMLPNVNMPMSPLVKGYESNALDGTFMGTAGVEQPVFQNGIPLMNDNGTPKKEVKNYKNVVLGVRYLPDGTDKNGQTIYKPYYASTESVVNSGYAPDAIPSEALQSPTVWKPLTQGVVDNIATANKYKLNYADFWKKRDAYQGNTPQTAKGTAAPTINKGATQAAPKANTGTSQADAEKKAKINAIRKKANLPPLP